MITTQGPWAVPASCESRRFFVLEPNEMYCGNQTDESVAYFNRVASVKPEHFAHFLYNRYMCRTKIHENKDIQMMIEAQREHLTPNHRGSATRIAKTGAVVSWTRCVAVAPVRRGLVGALGAGHCRAKRSEAKQGRTRAIVCNGHLCANENGRGFATHGRSRKPYVGRIFTRPVCH